MSVGHEILSRFQVVCAEREAWTEPDHGDSYYYDGFRFWRTGAKGKSRLVPSWQTPGYGWRHDAACACELCVAPAAAKVRTLSVA